MFTSGTEVPLKQRCYFFSLTALYAGEYSSVDIIV